jgi:hypothetical protein
MSPLSELESPEPDEAAEAGLPAAGLPGAELAGTGLAGTGLAGTGLAAVGLPEVGLTELSGCCGEGCGDVCAIPAGAMAAISRKTAVTNNFLRKEASAKMLLMWFLLYPASFEYGGFAGCGRGSGDQSPILLK